MNNEQIINALTRKTMKIGYGKDNITFERKRMQHVENNTDMLTLRASEGTVLSYPKKTREHLATYRWASIPTTINYDPEQP